MKQHHIPNILTALRILLVFPFFYALWNEHYRIAFYIFFIAGVSDALDGYLARAYHWSSRIGSIVDPLADKLLLVTAFFGLALMEKLPLWLLLLVLARDISIIIGGAAYHFLLGPFELLPTFVSKMNTFFQITLVVWMLFTLGFGTFSPLIESLLITTVTVTTLTSFIDYVWSWGSKALKAGRSRTL